MLFFDIVKDMGGESGILAILTIQYLALYYLVPFKPLWLAHF